MASRMQLLAPFVLLTAAFASGASSDENVDMVQMGLDRPHHKIEEHSTHRHHSKKATGHKSESKKDDDGYFYWRTTPGTNEWTKFVTTMEDVDINEDYAPCAYNGSANITSWTYVTSPGVEIQKTGSHPAPVCTIIESKASMGPTYCYTYCSPLADASARDGLTRGKKPLPTCTWTATTGHHLNGDNTNSYTCRSADAVEAAKTWCVGQPSCLGFDWRGSLAGTALAMCWYHGGDLNLSNDVSDQDAYVLDNRPCTESAQCVDESGWTSVSTGGSCETMTDPSVCTDLVDWKSSRGASCHHYQHEFDWCTSEGSYGAGWFSGWGSFQDYADHNNVTALDACCGCGGGEKACSAENSAGTKASTACCVCGGGSNSASLKREEKASAEVATQSKKSSKKASSTKHTGRKSSSKKSSKRSSKKSSKKGRKASSKKTSKK